MAHLSYFALIVEIIIETINIEGSPPPYQDVYLLGLAHRMGGARATFDHTIPIKARDRRERGIAVNRRADGLKNQIRKAPRPRP
jgi:hypothetical protein